MAVVRAHSGMQLVEASGKFRVIGDFVDHGSSKQHSVQALAWSSLSRLFSVGLDGAVLEWDVEGLRVRRQVDTHGGGAAWCCAVSKDGRLLAVGCENGSVHVFELIKVEGKETLVWKMNADVQLGDRVLAVSWSPCGTALAAASSTGAISYLDLAANKPRHRITVEPTTVRDEKNNRQKKDTIVWALAFTVGSDASVELWSADASGRLCCWSMATGTLIQAFPISTADLFCLQPYASSVIYAAGAEQKVFEMRRTEASGQWFLAGAARSHSHDIRSMTLCKDRLVTGSQDTTLVRWNAGQVAHEKTGRRFTAAPSASQCKLVESGDGIKHYLWANEGRSLRVWDVSSTDLSVVPRQLLHLRMASTQAIASFDVSPLGWLACRLVGGSVKIYRYAFIMKDGEMDVDLDEVKVSAGILSQVQAVRLDGSKLYCSVSQHQSWAVLKTFNLSGDILDEPTESLELPVKTVQDIATVNGIVAMRSNLQLVIMNPSLNKKSVSTLPLISALSTRLVVCIRAIIVVPGRELAHQVSAVMEPLCRAAGLHLGVVVGQTSLAGEQKKLLSASMGHSNVDILIATPGRLVDHLQQTAGFTLQHLEWLVLDEADRLLDQNFQDWLALVLKSTNGSTTECPLDTIGTLRPNQAPLESLCGLQCWSTPLRKLLFSATLTRNPAKLAQLHLLSPKFLSIASDGGSKYAVPDELTEFMLVAEDGEKVHALVHLLESKAVSRALCFTKSVEATNKLAALLQSVLPMSAERICSFSSDLQASQRQDLLQRFNAGALDVLVCSDGAARGLDLERVDTVISYDTPVHVKTYIHRVGRTARAGNRGSAYSLLESREAHHFKQMLAAGRSGKAAVQKVKLRPTDLEPIRIRVEEALSDLQADQLHQTVMQHFNINT